MSREQLSDGYETSHVDDLPQLFEGLIKLAREGLGVAGFGVQIMDLPPAYETESHDEAETGQQELYVALRGSGAVIVHGESNDERLELEPDRLVAVAPAASRTLASGPEGVRVLCVGGTPGQAYRAPDWTEGP